MKRRSLLLSLSLIFTLLLSSCANHFVATEFERDISAEAHSPVSLDDLLSIKTTPKTKPGTNLSKSALTAIGIEGVQFSMELDPKMSNDTAYRIVPTVEDQTYKVKIYHSESALTDAGANEELVQFMNNFPAKFKSNYAIFEIYFNAKADDFHSLQVLAKMRNFSFNNPSAYFTIDKEFKVDAEDRMNYWKDVLSKFETQERLYNKQIKPLAESRKAVMDALDKAHDDEQFRTLVAKNDRKGATELLRKYLPWEEMPPFEKMFWENHLKVMADPLPYEDRVIVYRGINDDIVQVAVEGGKELSRDEAIQEQKIFLMSTMMTKNQGTWNRRLRSLTAMYEKFMGTDENGSSEFTRSARITNMFYKHSREPKGSPFLSYTPRFSVAAGFGSQRNTAYFLDPRMIYFNYTSKYQNEVEFLLPIVSFPDDLAGVWDMKLHPGTGNVESFLNERAAEKLERELGAGKGKAVLDRIHLNSQKYFKPVLATIKNGAVKTPVAQKPDGKIMGFFKGLLGIPTKKAADIINEDSDMGCTDLIQLFWK